MKHSGKTTIINLITGLITPSSGEMVINNDKNFINDWQNLISYVPQKIYITNSSIKFNITFKEKLSSTKKINLFQYLN